MNYAGSKKKGKDFCSSPDELERYFSSQFSDGKSGQPYEIIEKNFAHRAKSSVRVAAKESSRRIFPPTQALFAVMSRGLC